MCDIHCSRPEARCVERGVLPRTTYIFSRAALGSGVLTTAAAGGATAALDSATDRASKVAAVVEACSALVAAH